MAVRGRVALLAALLAAVLLLGFCLAAHAAEEEQPDLVGNAAAPGAGESAAAPGLKARLLAAYEKVANFDSRAALDRTVAAVQVLRETDYRAMAAQMWETARAGDIRNVDRGLLLAYLALVVMAVVPIVLGARASIAPRVEGQEAPEIMSSGDAAYFPIQASITLFSLYMLFMVRLPILCLCMPVRCMYLWGEGGGVSPACVRFVKVDKVSGLRCRK